jgi:hypothetical protein
MHEGRTGSHPRMDLRSAGSRKGIHHQDSTALTVGQTTRRGASAGRYPQRSLTKGATTPPSPRPAPRRAELLVLLCRLHPPPTACRPRHAPPPSPGTFRLCWARRGVGYPAVRAVRHQKGKSAEDADGEAHHLARKAQESGHLQIIGGVPSAVPQPSLRPPVHPGGEGRRA